MTSHSSAPVAVITGGGSGIGLAVADLLCRRGWSLLLAGRDEKRLAGAARSLPLGRASRALLHAADVGDPAQAAGMIERAVREFARLDALVNNAGCAELVPLERTTRGLIERSFAVNAIGPACAVAAAWPVFMRQKEWGGRGCVVNVSSIATDDPFPGFFAYASAKGAMNAMARSIAKEGATVGVRGFCVAPGAVETAMLRSAFDASVIPPSACLAPADVARVIVDCIEGRRDADNGATIFLRRSDTAKNGIIERVQQSCTAGA